MDIAELEKALNHEGNRVTTLMSFLLDAPGLIEHLTKQGKESLETKNLLRVLMAEKWIKTVKEDIMTSYNKKIIDSVKEVMGYIDVNKK